MIGGRIHASDWWLKSKCGNEDEIWSWCFTFLISNGIFFSIFGEHLICPLQQTSPGHTNILQSEKFLSDFIGTKQLNKIRGDITVELFIRLYWKNEDLKLNQIYVTEFKNDVHVLKIKSSLMWYVNYTYLIFSISNKFPCWR